MTKTMWHNKFLEMPNQPRSFKISHGKFSRAIRGLPVVKKVEFFETKTIRYLKDILLASAAFLRSLLLISSCNKLRHLKKGWVAGMHSDKWFSCCYDNSFGCSVASNSNFRDFNWEIPINKINMESGEDKWYRSDDIRKCSRKYPSI